MILGSFFLVLSGNACLAVTRTTDLAPEFQEANAAGAVPWALIGITFVVIAAASGCYWFVRHLRVPALSIADDLTLELCRVHGIGLQHRMALDHVARLAGIEQTAELFLSPNLYDQAIGRANRKKRLKGRQLDSLHSARRLLFGNSD